jgi:ABC-type glycerol-3-phosphate transport system substrate-binding protein
MKRKLLVGFLLLIILATAFGSPQKEPTGALMSESKTEWGKAIKQKYGGMEITVAAITHPTTDGLKALVPDFTKETGITINWQIMDSSTLIEKALLEHQSRTGVYDVIYLFPQSLPLYHPTRVLIDLEPLINDRELTPDWFDYEDILPAFRKGIGSFEDVIYGIPIGGEGRYVAYRTDLFNKYGKEPPDTLEQLLGLATFFKGRESGLYGIAYRGAKGAFFASGFLTTMYPNGGRIVDRETWEVLVDRPATIDALKWHIELLKQGPPDIATYTHEEAFTAFASGKTALWYDATALTPWIMDPEKSRVYEKVAFIPPPCGPAGCYGALGGKSLGISSDISNDRKEAAWAFLAFVGSRKMAKKYVRSGGNIVRQSVFSDPELIAEDPTLPVQMEAIQRANNLVEDGLTFHLPTIKYGKITSVLGTYGHAALVGEMSPENAMQKAASEIEEILKED